MKFHKKWEKSRVDSPKLSSVTAVLSVQRSQFESSTFFSTIAETLIKQEFSAQLNFLSKYSINCSVGGDLFSKSLSAIVQKFFLVSNHTFMITRLSSYRAWVEYSTVIKLQLSQH